MAKFLGQGLTGLATSTILSGGIVNQLTRIHFQCGTTDIGTRTLFHDGRAGSVFFKRQGNSKTGSHTNHLSGGLWTFALIPPVLEILGEGGKG